MDYRKLWVEYQHLRSKYTTDDIQQWTAQDRQRAVEIRNLIENADVSDIHDSMWNRHRQGDKKTTLQRKLISCFLRGSK